MAKPSKMEVTDKWVAEFFLRRLHSLRVSPANLLSSLKLKDSPDCLNLKISSVLRDISDSLNRATIDEGTLDLLETLAKLRSPLLTDSHKSAYCWTAAECTVRFMWPLRVSDGLLSEAVERIWRKRIRVLKESGSGLVSDELLKWEGDVEAAVEGGEVYQRLRESNVRFKAVDFLTQLLEEQWGLIGSSALESVAQRRLLKRKAVDNAESSERRGSGNNDRVNEQHGGDEEEGTQEQEQEQETSVGKGDKAAARDLKECLLKMQRQIEASTSHVQEPGCVTPKRARVNRTGTRSGQDHNETQDNVSDSQGTSSGRVRPHLPTPEPLNVSPLRKVFPAPRRKKKFWTPEEEKVLREGVKEFGKSWKEIKNANPVVLAERTEVDLKDKWRNITR